MHLNIQPFFLYILFGKKKNRNCSEHFVPNSLFQTVCSEQQKYPVRNSLSKMFGTTCSEHFVPNSLFGTTKKSCSEQFVENVRNNVFGTKFRFCSEQNSDSVRNKIAFFVPNTLFGIIFSEQLSGYVFFEKVIRYTTK